MLNLMKISWPVSLTWRVCHLWLAILIKKLCLILLLSNSLTGFQLQFLMMTVRMKIHLLLLMFLQLYQLSHPDFDPVALDVYDVYIVNDHGVELKAKDPPLISNAMFWI